MNEGRTHFADDATLTYIYTLEARVQLLAKALTEIWEEGEGYIEEDVAEGGKCWKEVRSPAAEIAKRALTEVGLNEQKEG